MSVRPVLLLIGKDGQLGFELQRVLLPLGRLHALGRRDCDLTNSVQLRNVVRELQPDIVINAAAYTAVDKAETEAALAHAVNAAAPAVLAAECADSGALLVHYSTDYVFDGSKNGRYAEDDVPNPLSVYGASKLAGEQAITASASRHLIFRTSWVFGSHGGNFVKTILRLAAERETLSVVADQHGAPTSTPLIAGITAGIIKGYRREANCNPPASGIYHLAAGGETTWFEYAQAIVAGAAKAGVELRLRPGAIKAIPAAEYPLPARRPANSRLDCRKLTSDFGITLPQWQAGLSAVLAQVLQSGRYKQI
jgi:dTDP-4-dehydrorhamnose reductase